MDIFKFDDYRDYLKEAIEMMPNKGYGKLSELALSSGMNPATLTLVLKKERDFTLDQAHATCLFLGLGEIETEYFLTSASLQRAGKNHLKNLLIQKLSDLRDQSQNLQKRLGRSKDLDENSKAQFYSAWFYSGVRLAASIPKLDNVDSISERLELPRATVAQVVEFLLHHNLLKSENGKLGMATQSTHLSAQSPLVSRHHTNWRIKSLSKMESTLPDELFFTSPVSIAQKDIPVVRDILARMIDEVFRFIDPSKEEELACLNIDWFRI